MIDALGFSGTQIGMSRAQVLAFIDYLQRHTVVSFHHGDCIGADAQAHALVQQYSPLTEIYIHPSTVKDKRAYCKDATMVFSARHPLHRNQIIIDLSTDFIATPKEVEEVLRSGTWATIRYAWKKFGKRSEHVTILPPITPESLFA